MVPREPKALSSLRGDSGVRQHRQNLESQKTSNQAQYHVVDCLIVGADPAGLTAAIYLARYRRQVLLVNAGKSRAELIPITHN